VSDSSGLSRRALFGQGLFRLVEGIDDRQPTPAPDPVATVDPARYALRQLEAWNASHGMRLWAQASSELLEAAACDPGARTLDAGAGDGSLALLAAQRGAAPTACDTAAALVARGRARAAAAGVHVDWLEADMAALPFGAGFFDCALSAFAPMFCLQPRAAIGELFRVTRPGGTVAFTTWTVGGIVGRLLRLAAEHDPPPAGVPRPLTWGREEQLRTELELHTDRADLTHGTLTMRFATREDAADRLLRALGPLAAASHDATFRPRALAIVDELAQDADDHHVCLPARYLVAVAQCP